MLLVPPPYPLPFVMMTYTQDEDTQDTEKSKHYWRVMTEKGEFSKANFLAFL